LNFVTYNVLQLQHKHLQLLSWSRRTNDYFEVSDLEDPARFFSKSPSQTPGARFQSLDTTN
jgi:hypothetical protein